MQMQFISPALVEDREKFQKNFQLYVKIARKKLLSM